MKPGAHSGGLLAVAILAVLLGTLAVALRLYTRKVVLNQVGIDDYFAIISWICLMALAIQNFLNINAGLGSHFMDIPIQVQPSFLFYLWLGLVIYNICLLFTKLTFFFQFYRILRETSLHRLKIIYIATMAIIASWQVGQVFVQVFACIPVRASWDITVRGNCQAINSTRVMNVVVNIVTDFIILLLPLPVIWRLRLPKSQRWALTGIFSLGFFTCIISILRATATMQGGIGDVSWDTVISVSWSTAEIMTGIIVAALSTLRPLLSRYVPGLRSLATSDGSASASHRLQSMRSRRRSSAFLSAATGSGKPAATFSSSAPSRRSNIILSYPAPMGTGAGAWLDLSDSGESDHAGPQVPEPAQLGPERRGSTSRMEILVTKEWSVHD